MGKIVFSMNGKEVHAEKGATILEVARHVGIRIPHMCYHEDVAPYGACRLCLVEIKKGSRSRLVASCAYEVEDGLDVWTRSDRVVRVRKLLIELLLAIAPYMREVQELAAEYDVRETRYRKIVSPCILCGLCVRYCAEVRKDHAVGFVGRGVDRQVAWIPPAAYDEDCTNCLECMDICPTGVFPSNFGMSRLDGLEGVLSDFKPVPQREKVEVDKPVMPVS
ncbi:2Fe-2S iron-sulfur cluster-binding protein [Planctomycetota bacterium]